MMLIASLLGEKRKILDDIDEWQDVKKKMYKDSDKLTSEEEKRKTQLAEVLLLRPSSLIPYLLTDEALLALLL